MNDFDGPFFAPGLIGADGKLSRLHKGGAKPPKTIAPPPPVRESNRQVAAEGETERAAAAKRKGVASTVNPGGLLGTFDQPGSRSLL